MLSIAEDLSLALDCGEVFKRCIGGDPDPWQLRVLEWCASGDPAGANLARKLFLLTSRQAGKTSVVSVATIIQSLWGCPGGTTILAAPSMRQSSSVMRVIMKAYRRLTAGRDDAQDLEAESKCSVTLANGSRILCVPGSNDGNTLRGEVADTILVDEIFFTSAELVQSLRPMISTKGGRGKLILLGTPRYASGFAYDLWRSGDPSWQREKITAAQCPRIDPQWLENERREIGDAAKSEYDCEFVDPGAAIFGSEILEAALSDDINVIRW